MSPESVRIPLMGRSGTLGPALPGPAKAFFVLRQCDSPWCKTLSARASLHDLLSSQQAHLGCGKREGLGRECIRFESSPRLCEQGS